MTNSPGYYSGYSGYGAPGAGYGDYSYVTGTPVDDDQRSRAAWIAVALLGLATFGISFFAPAPLGWTVWFSVLAAVIAAVGLLPAQDNRGWLVVALAVTGFLSALSTWLHADGAGWAVVVVVVLNALQAIAAVAGLLLDGGAAPGAAQGQPDYAAYTQYAQAYQAYAMQYQQGPPPQVGATGQATGQAHSAATAHGHSSAAARGQGADAAQESYEALQERYTQHGGYPPAPPQRGSSGAPTTAGPDPGIPSYGRGPSSQPSGIPQEDRGEASSN